MSDVKINALPIDFPIRDFPNRYILKVSNALMLNEEFNKMIYYNSVDNQNIYKLPKLDDPITTLKDKKVFLNRRIDKILTDADISVFINVYRDIPYTHFYKTSPIIRELKLEIGVICHNDCRNTLNGLREIIVFKKIQDILLNDPSLRGIGRPVIESTYPMYNMPYEYVGYALVISLEYFKDM